MGTNKGILLDADGTLWDSVVQVTESWNEALARYPHLGARITAQDMCDNMGKTMMDIGETLFPGLAQEECRKVTEERMAHENHYLLTHPEVLYPEAGEIMARLSCQYGLYIVSNCQSGYIEVLLKSCSFREYVRDIGCYSNTGLPKGDNIRAVVRRNHLERCSHAGDIHVDEEVTGVAGILFVHASYGFDRAERPVGTTELLNRLPALAKKLLDQEQDMNQGECKEIKQALELSLDESLEQALMSNPAGSSIISRFGIRPLLMKGRLVFQMEEQAGKQVFHRSLDKDEVVDYITELLEGSFRRAKATSGLGKALILVSRKGKVTVKVKRYPGFVRIQPAGEPGSLDSLSHNQKKHYVLEEGIPASSLMDLGVVAKEGRVVNSRHDEYRQINCLLGFIEDILPNLDQGWESAIIDFGCGKPYPTSAMYYCLKELEGYPVRITGLDLEEDAIEYYSRLGWQYGYDGLSFCYGDTASFEGVEKVGMVVTLYACDLATDYALEKAVNWGARVILSVSCCQHELNGQMENSLLGSVLQYGLIKECMAALYTDAIRAQVLEYRGYRTQILEFINMEHTPENILIRAVRQGRKRDNDLRIRELAEFLHVRPTVVELLALEFREPREKITDI